MTDLHVLSVTSEIFPLVKTGGLADVAGALPAALAAEGVRVVTLVPGYPAVLAALEQPQAVVELHDLPGGTARVIRATAQGLDLAILDAPHLFDRPGNPYLGPDGRDWPDNAIRFIAFAHAGARLARGAAPGLVPDVVHCHDWQAALVPALLSHGGPRPATVLTVHNLAFQGQFPASVFPLLGLPPEAFSVDGVEYYGDVGFLKAGLRYADRITTVSPTYGYEIMTQAGGMGLDGLIRSRADALSGIRNGLDLDVWDPSADAHLAAPYSRRNPARRVRNKAALAARFGLDVPPETLLFGVVSRLTWQKGIDLLAEVAHTIVDAGAALVVVGNGEWPIEAALSAAAERHPGRIGLRFGYDEALAHLVQGGADALLVPSRFEPCGLTQLSALRYGAVPVAARVGGLADTIVDANEMALAADAGTGVLFSPPTREAFELAVRRTAALWRDQEVWRAVQKRGMATDVGWTVPAQRYAALFRHLVAGRAG